MALRNVSVDDLPKLPSATLYTTLEPCTREVRSNELECCTELILQHKIKRVFVGILDPNQGVRGNGLVTLQNAGIEVILFPHELAQQVIAINASFIRSQRRLGAEIVSPTKGESLRTYETDGRHLVRFNCLNPPTSSNHLLIFRQGLCWPQPAQFRQVEDKLWEIAAHFGATGQHDLHIVTVTDLGALLFNYYWKIVRENEERKNRIERNECDPKIVGLLGDPYPGIEITTLPKGIRSEASVDVVIEPRPS